MANPEKPNKKIDNIVEDFSGEREVLDFFDSLVAVYENFEGISKAENPMVVKSQENLIRRIRDDEQLKTHLEKLIKEPESKYSGEEAFELKKWLSDLVKKSEQLPSKSERPSLSEALAEQRPDGVPINAPLEKKPIRDEPDENEQTNENDSFSPLNDESEKFKEDRENLRKMDTQELGQTIFQRGMAFFKALSKFLGGKKDAMLENITATKVVSDALEIPIQPTVKELYAYGKKQGWPFVKDKFMINQITEGDIVLFKKNGEKDPDQVAVVTKEKPLTVRTTKDGIESEIELNKMPEYSTEFYGFFRVPDNIKPKNDSGK
ncbi:hypothetical protein GF340_03275 [Candidatus Peregrinibacteria bacterium]|nr:hypothetical protein [Candidatus Peregrinibacteria bacterium]